jgi:hypothetical protein
MIGYETLSTEGIVRFGKIFLDLMTTSFPHTHLFRERSKRLQWSSSLNNSDQHHDDGDVKQDMNLPANRVATDQSRKPQN